MPDLATSPRLGSAKAPFSQIPHSILTALAAQALSGAEFQVVLAILYELYRWEPDGAKPKAIGAFDFQQATNLTRRTIKRTIKSLERQRIIRVQRQPERRKTSVYSLSPTDHWRPRVTLASVTHATSTSDAQDTRTSDSHGQQLVTPTTPLRNNTVISKEGQEGSRPSKTICGYGHPVDQMCPECYRVSGMQRPTPTYRPLVSAMGD